MRLEGSDSVQVPTMGTGDTWGGTAGDGGGSRVRFVKLHRRKGVSFGFHLRGGREHGTGFFISHVEPNSEAQVQGLRAGDQVLRVNQMSVEGAVHKEVAAMVQASSTVILQVKGAGIIPIKDSRPRYISKQNHPCSSSISSGRYRRRGDPLTWLMVEDDPYEHETASQSHNGGTSLAESELEYIPNPRRDGHPYQQADSQGSESPNGASLVSERVIINVNRDGIGCSICKGPPEKPGIYVQSVKSGGVARESGLRGGDLILACNNTPFTRLQFQEAVYVLKSSNRLVLDVVHGAGLELVTGESSGYNSSASSVAGDQTPPSRIPSNGEHKSYHGQDPVTNRLSAVSKHLQLDTNRGWKEIEAEWAQAEAEEKRRQLNLNQKILKTQKQRDALHTASLAASSMSSSQSMGNLLTRDEENGEASTVFRDEPASTKTFLQRKSRKYNTVIHKPLLRSTRSTSDIRLQNGNHKIALVTSADPHVNNIVITEGPKDEKDAVSRLDMLSSSSSRLDSSSSGSIVSTDHKSSSSRLDTLTKNHITSSRSDLVYSSSADILLEENLEAAENVEEQMKRLKLEQKRLMEEAERLKEERRKFEEEKRGLLRSHSVPLAPLVIQCSGSTIESPPSPTPSSSSGRHTSKILIKSSPPAPPPRDTSTTLSTKSRRQHRSHNINSKGHHFCHHQMNNNHTHSPPSSPSASIASSSGIASSCSSSGGMPPRRCKSIGSLSASSGESTIWEDIGLNDPSVNSAYSNNLNSSSSTLISLGLYDNNSNSHTNFNSNPHYMTNDSIRQLIPPPPTLPKPSRSTVLATVSSTTNNVFSPDKDHISTIAPSRIPPPPPPPPAPTTRCASSLANALSAELERRTNKEVRGKIDEEERARVIQEKIDNYKKEKKTKDPMKAQHDQLMEEFKMAHRRMFNGKDDEDKTSPRTAISKNGDLVKLNPMGSKEHKPEAEHSVKFSISSQVIGNKKNLISSSSTADQEKNSVYNQVPNPNSIKNPYLNHVETNVIKQSYATDITSSTIYSNINKQRNKKETEKTVSDFLSRKSIPPPPPMPPSQKSVIIPNSKKKLSEAPFAHENDHIGSQNVSTNASTSSNQDFLYKTIARSPREPETYFQKYKTNKPLVCIESYPSPSQRPQPKKMDFLHGESSVCNLKHIDPSREGLQNELTSTLKRSNLRQRHPPQEITVQVRQHFDSSLPFNEDEHRGEPPSLSEKYQSLTENKSINIIVSGIEDQNISSNDDGTPAGILKPAGPTKPYLQKTISFGDVTSMDDEVSDRL